MSDAFAHQNDLKQGDAFSSKLLKFGLEYAFRTFQLLVYENDLNLLGRDIIP